jgi:pimeloyl-ACP methyl ester carboxylesterase
MRVAVVTASVLALAGCGAGGGSSASAPPPVHAVTPPAVLPDYVLTPGSGKLVVLMGMTKEDATSGILGDMPARLISAGYKLLALDLPCHGADADPALPMMQLLCWRNRIEAGDRQVFAKYCAGLSAVFDDLVVDQAYIVGQSRGGYVAAICAFSDARIRKVAMIAPVTDLQRLTEFDGYQVDQSVYGLMRLAPWLRAIDIRVRIGNNDERVSTESAVAFAKLVGAELDIVDVPGHVPLEDGSTIAWLGVH